MILLAGGTGLLGSAISTRLLDQGRPVRALVRSAERAAALRQMSAGALMGSGPPPFDPGPMLERYPVTLITLEEWVRARYRQSAPSA